MKKAKMTESDFDILLNTLLEQITLVPFNDFEQEYPRAIRIMESIDENDAPFLAVGLALRLDGIWTKRPAFSPAGSHQSISHERSCLKIIYKNRPGKTGRVCERKRKWRRAERADATVLITTDDTLKNIVSHHSDINGNFGR